MSAPRSGPTALDREFLAIRSGLIDLAAALDRIDRHDGAAGGDPRLVRIRRGLEILLADAGSRAEQIQAAFSLPYDEGWRDKS